jgi:hypothetical protein
MLADILLAIVVAGFVPASMIAWALRRDEGGEP